MPCGICGIKSKCCVVFVVLNQNPSFVLPNTKALFCTFLLRLRTSSRTLSSGNSAMMNYARQTYVTRYHSVHCFQIWCKDCVVTFMCNIYMWIFNRVLSGEMHCVCLSSAPHVPHRNFRLMLFCFVRVRPRKCFYVRLCIEFHYKPQMRLHFSAFRFQPSAWPRRCRHRLLFFSKLYTKLLLENVFNLTQISCSLRQAAISVWHQLVSTNSFLERNTFDLSAGVGRPDERGQVTRSPGQIV